MIKNKQILLVTPPFTQLNTPYPATAYLKGFFNTQAISSSQVDLGLTVTLSLFSAKGLTRIFDHALPADTAPQLHFMHANKSAYINTIDAVIRFLQGNDPTLAHLIHSRSFLPEGARFEELNYLEWAFGNLGVQDAAKHIATLYLEDLADYIRTLVDPHFGFSRYAEKLALAITTFDHLYHQLQAPDSLVDELTIQALEAYITTHQPKMVGLSVPFPGNLYAALKCGQYLKRHYPGITVVMGGGYPNTELRSLTDIRVFEFVDYITLDDGELPWLCLWDLHQGKRNKKALKRTFYVQDGAVVYVNGAPERDFSHEEKGTPDYTDLDLNKYISVLEQTNPMHRLWTDGRWNKLTLAHGCYWGKCTFCDTSLDYIGNYQPATAAFLVDQIVQIVADTQHTGFHFVDEAAPPSLLRDLSLELIRRNVRISWWANIRFEKSFTKDLCQLMQKAGCIAVSGGLEVASDRLLKLIKKGVSLQQVAGVTHHFNSAHIMVHAYLMYGFPTQTAQETIDALEVVRQLFENDLIQSAYWHQFSMTAHSPIGLSPKSFNVTALHPELNAFANNDMLHDDPSGADHGRYSDGLKTSLFNYMNHSGLAIPLRKWFDFHTPKTTVSPHLIAGYVQQSQFTDIPLRKKLHAIHLQLDDSWSQNGKMHLIFTTYTQQKELQFPIAIGKWWQGCFKNITTDPQQVSEVKRTFEEKNLGVFVLFWNTPEMEWLKNNGLLTL